MKIDDLNKLLEDALGQLDKVDVKDVSDDEKIIKMLENKFQTTLDSHEEFMMEAVGGNPDIASFEQKRAVFNVMTALHDIISVQDQLEMPN